MELENTKKSILKFKKFSENAKISGRATSGSAGIDLCACIEQDVVIKPGEKVFIKCGIGISLENSNYVGLIFARSGLSVKHGITLTNGVGVIDSDYRGELGVGLYNISNKEYVIKSGDRIAQLLIMRVETPDLQEVQELDTTDRNTGGFGSTGK